MIWLRLPGNGGCELVIEKIGAPWGRPLSISGCLSAEMTTICINYFFLKQTSPSLINLYTTQIQNGVIFLSNSVHPARPSRQYRVNASDSFAKTKCIQLSMRTDVNADLFTLGIMLIVKLGVCFLGN